MMFLLSSFIIYYVYLGGNSIEMCVQNEVLCCYFHEKSNDGFGFYRLMQRNVKQCSIISAFMIFAHTSKFIQ